MLKELEFDPRRLTLEITEGVLMSNPDQARRAMDALKAVGIGFALDDFGCGYASIRPMTTAFAACSLITKTTAGHRDLSDRARAYREKERPVNGH
ncbi:EAL domain-containing protein [Rhizobium leguminosarum]|uniref:EAL domain-containing protein n=1 Tax=Rhizobium laguerreae TaxID=1076926 RepID=A0A7Y2RA13_9HYPH|nr:EAL domain-containing protein [Rhizobium leguminosarum]NNH67140.1 EAL domain-containing protein [Rhizobium laguerreae]